MSSSRSTGIPLLRIRLRETGTIRDVRKSVAHVDGLPACINGELLDMGQGVPGLVMGFNEEGVLALILGDESSLRMGGEVKGESEPFHVPVGDRFLGRIIGPLGAPIDGGPEIATDLQRAVFSESPPITARSPVDAFLRTGTRIVDCLVPIGKGQRQLVIGDRMTGKTTLALDAVLAQGREGPLCIYCCVGKTRSSLDKVVVTLRDGGCLAHALLVVALDNATAGEQFLAPYAAACHAEHFAASGRDVLVVFDDLTKHAWAYRQLSLLLERPPGREAYPGDVFYVQTQLMERAGRFNAEHGGGSITYLALAETLDGDLTAYIPSNLVSMCDGMVFLNTDLFHDGQRPAVDPARSFSIVGGRAQPPALRALAATLPAELATYRETQRLAAIQQVVAPAAVRALQRGPAILGSLTQPPGRPASLADEILVLAALAANHLDGLAADALQAFVSGLGPFAAAQDATMWAELERGEAWSAELRARVADVLARYAASREGGATAA